ncbi:MAG: TRAP transporter small permease [Hyphomicrobiales bacterium]|nr:TRAP transporter small permease [Hyphomicrobiales bacterium]
MSDEPQGEAGAAAPKAGALADRIAEATRRFELYDPDQGLPLIERLVNRAVEAIGALALCGIVAVVFSNALARYLLNTSFLWAEEVVLLLVPWLAMTGVFLSVRRGSMIRIDFFFEKLPAKWRRPIGAAGYAISIAVLLFMGWVSFDFLRLFGGDVAVYLNIRIGWSTSALSFGAFGAALAFLVAFHHERRREKRRALRS